MRDSYYIPDHLVRMVKEDVPINDILHGELKVLLAAAEELTASPEYVAGYGEALAHVYRLTYDLGFAIQDFKEGRL